MRLIFVPIESAHATSYSGLWPISTNFIKAACPPLLGSLQRSPDSLPGLTEDDEAHTGKLEPPFRKGWPAISDQ